MTLSDSANSAVYVVPESTVDVLKYSDHESKPPTMLIDFSKAKKWWQASQPHLFSEGDEAVLAPFESNGISYHGTVLRSSFKFPVGVKTANGAIRDSIMLPPMSIAYDSDVNASVFKDTPAFSLVGWGHHRNDKFALDTSTPAIRQFHIIAQPVYTLHDMSFKDEWTTATSALSKMQEEVWDWMPKHANLIDIVRANVKPSAGVKLVDDWQRDVVSVDKDMAFSTFMKTHSKYTNILQASSFSGWIMHVFRYVQDV